MKQPFRLLAIEASGRRPAPLPRVPSGGLVASRAAFLAFTLRAAPIPAGVRAIDGALALARDFAAEAAA